MTILLDSVVLIDHFNGRPEATAYIRSVHAEAAISIITRAEVMAGFDAPGASLARTLLDIFPTLPGTRAIADEAALLRREHRWKLPDAFQAAFARIHQLKLATRNVRDFPPDRFSFITVPY